MISMCGFLERLKPGAAILAAAATIVAAGCSVPATEPDAVAVDTGILGRIIPGAYFVLSWPTAESKCHGENRTAEIQDVKNGVATYRCVDR